MSRFRLSARGLQLDQAGAMAHAGGRPRASHSNRPRCLWPCRMKPLTREDVIPLQDYEHQRDSFVPDHCPETTATDFLGPLISLVFEIGRRCSFKTQEMIRAEQYPRPPESAGRIGRL